MKKIEQRDLAKARWLSTKALVVDERKHIQTFVIELTQREAKVPMIAAEFLDMLDGLARNIRGNNTPFGGIQVRVFHQVNSWRLCHFSS